VLAPAAHAALFSDDEARRGLIDLRNRVEQAEQARQKSDTARDAKDADATKQQDALRRSLLDLSQQIEQLRGELAQLRGTNELLARDVTELQRKQKDVQQGLDERVAKLEPQKVTVDGKEFLVDADEKRQYEEGIARMRTGDWENAATLLSGFLRRFPTSGYRESALYWLGNARFGQKDFKEALSTFRALTSSYPSHQRVPETMLAIANCHIELKEQKAARLVLEDLVKNYPKTEAAQVARERLAVRQ
jgi:tol-pal system protein YbgF